MPLIVVYLDDEPDIGDMFKDNFGSADVLIHVYAKPQVAITAISRLNPDLVFLDYRLPNTNGDIVASQLPARIPKVLITGDLAVDLQSHFIKVFYKPFDFEEMDRFIKDFARKKLPKALASKVP